MSLAAALAVFDEAALAVLANKGLVRRAQRDVEDGKVAIAAITDDVATVAADGETVTIDARGPAKARCTCPAPGVCRHRIGAVLVVQGRAQPHRPSTTSLCEAVPLPVPGRSEEAEYPPRNGEGDQPQAGGGAVRPDDPVVMEITTLPEPDLIRATGRASWRAALEIAEHGATIARDGTALLIHLTDEPELPLRYLPGLGLAGMISRAPPARRRALHAAALIAVRSQAGIAPEPPETPADAAPVDTAIDPLFLADIRAALGEACRSGLALAPLALEERLFTASVSSRAEALPRLAALLRVIARMLRARRARDAGFDPDLCLGRIATAHALTRALAADTPSRDRLIGAVRQDYADGGPLHLHGLAAEVWQSDGGARGVTGWFYAPGQDRWFSAAIARGAGQDPTFDPTRAFSAQSVFGGMTLKEASGSELHFDGLAVSAEGRMSTAGAARPHAIGAAVPQPDWPCVIDDWADLTRRLRARLAGSLTHPAPAVEPVLLRPRRIGPARFDDLAQRLCVPLEDGHGRQLTIGIAHESSPLQRRAKVAEAVLTPGADLTIVALASMAGSTITLSPIASHGRSGPCLFDFDTPPREGRSLASLFRRGGAHRAAARPAAHALIGRIVSELTGLAETGCRPADAERFTALSAQADDAGLPTLAAALGAIAGADDLPDAILRCRYVADLVMRQVAVLEVG